MRNRFTIFLSVFLLIGAVACRVEKTGEDTYKVEVPTDEAEAAAENAKEKAVAAGQEIKEETKEIAGDIAKSASDALNDDDDRVKKPEDAPQKTPEYSKPPQQNPPQP